MKKILNKLSSFVNKFPKLTLVLAAGASFFAYAPFNIWPLIFISFAVLIYLLDKAKSSKQQLVWFSLFVFKFNIINLHWVGNSFLYHSPEEYLVYFMPLLVLGMAALLSLPYILVFWLFNKASESTAKKIVLVPAVFLLVEFLRSLTVYGFPWNLVGYSIASNDYLLQASELGTVLVCTFLILIIASLVSTLKKKYVITAAVIFVVWFTAGLIRFETIDRTRIQELSSQTKTIQIDTTKHHNFDRIKMKKQVFAYIDEVKKVKYNKDINLIVLPEMAMPYPINTEESLLKLLQRSIGKHQSLIVGAPAYNDYDIYNTMYFINKQGFKRYDKIMLVPFGEFMPMRKMLPFIKNLTNNFKDFSVGYIANTVEFADKKYLGLICYEGIFPFFVKENIRDTKNTILVNITNDAWFYGTVAPYQHKLITKTRAVENNLPMIRVANAGYSFIK